MSVLLNTLLGIPLFVNSNCMDGGLEELAKELRISHNADIEQAELAVVIYNEIKKGI